MLHLLEGKLEKLSWAANADAAFTDRGFTNWKMPLLDFLHMKHLVVAKKRS